MDNNQKMHDYGDGRVKRLQFIYGNQQAAIAIAEGFRWTGSTQTHDIYTHHTIRVQRCINKETKRFYEQRI